MVNIFHPPPSVVASWPKPNYTNPVTQGPGLVVIGIIMIIMGIIIVTTRLYARIFITRALGVDDILIVCAAICATTFTILCIIANLNLYTGVHIWDLKPSSYVPHRINIWVSELCIILSLSFTKISVLLFYRRLSVSFSRKFFIAVWVGIIYNILYAISFLLTLCLICRPIQAWWLNFDPTWVAKHAHSVTCGKERVMEPLSAILSTVSDIYTASLPMILISRLDLPSKQKHALYSLFGLAWLVVISGVIRIAYIYLTVIAAYDFTWKIWEQWILTIMELWTAIFVASAPALKPIVKRLGTVVGQSYGAASQRINGKKGTGAGHTEDTRELAVTEDMNGSVSTKGGEMGGVIMMTNGAVTNSQKGHSIATVGSVDTLQDTLNNEENAPVKGEGWGARKEGPWNRLGSSEP